MTVELDAIVERLAAEGDRRRGRQPTPSSTETSVTAFQGEVERLTSASSSGVGVRWSRRRLGYAYTADLSDEGLRECLAEARANLEVSGEDGRRAPGRRRLPGAGRPVRHPPGRGRPRARGRSGPRPGGPHPGRRPQGHPGRVGPLRRRGRRGRGRLLDPGWRARSPSPTPGASRSPWPPRTTRARWATPSTPPAPSTTSTSARWPARPPTGPCMLGATKLTRTVPVVFDRMVAPASSGSCWPACRPRRCKRRSLFADRLGEQVGASGLRLVDDGRLVAGPGAARSTARGSRRAGPC